MKTLQDINWLVSLLAAIPLSIAANLLTPIVRDWFGRRSGRQAARRVNELEREFAFLSEMKSSDTELLRYVLWSLLKVLVYFALASAVATLSGLVPMFADTEPAYAVFSALSALLYLLAFNRGQEASRFLYRIRHFECEKDKLEERLAVLRTVAGGTLSKPPAPEA